MTAYGHNDDINDVAYVYVSGLLNCLHLYLGKDGSGHNKKNLYIS